MTGDKAFIRKSVLHKRNLLCMEEVIYKSGRITDRLLETGAFLSGAVVMCYMAINNEVRTGRLIDACLSLGKKVLLPRVEDIPGGRKEIVPYEVKDMETGLEKGVYGIPEPKREMARRADPQEIDLIIVPGVAFDLQRNRIGYGAGYYDAFLRKVRKDCRKIGIAYELQLVESIPAEENDVPMDWVITEDRIL